MCWATTTWSSKISQWKRFSDFCEQYNLVVLPASVDTICLYITYLCGQVKYSTIANYLSSVWSLHDYYGVEPMAKNSFLVKCTMRGARRLLGDSTLSADPLLPTDLVKIYHTLNYKSLLDLVFWTALCVGYRCLLRKGHFTASSHTIKRSDLVFTDYGFCLTITSSKTVQFRERVVKIPVVEAPSSVLCPVKWLRMYLNRVNVPMSGPLFLSPGKRASPLSYRMFSSKLSSSLTKAGISGNFSSHSLRRGCATFLSRLGLPLHDIKMYGDWRSLSVLFYLSNDVSTRLSKDISVANEFNTFVA